MKSYIKHFIFSVFLWNSILVFSQEDTLNDIIKLDEVEILSNSQKTISSSVLRKSRKSIATNYSFKNGVNYKVVSNFKNIKTNTFINIELLASFKKLFSSKVQILKSKSNKDVQFNHLFQIVYANLNWGKKVNGETLSFKEDSSHFYIETGSKYQSNFYKINRKDFSYEKIIVRRKKLGKKVINCENSRLELTFKKEKKHYHPEKLSIKCFNDLDSLVLSHKLRFTETLPYEKISSKNNNDVYRILRLYTDKNKE